MTPGEIPEVPFIPPPDERRDIHWQLARGVVNVYGALYAPDRNGNLWRLGDPAPLPDEGPGGVTRRRLVQWMCNDLPTEPAWTRWLAFSGYEDDAPVWFHPEIGSPTP